MTTRRGFLSLLGMGGIALGLPGAAQAFGRRRRCRPSSCECEPAVCPSCGAPAAAPSAYQLQDTLPACGVACIVAYYGESNGVYYYYCQCCGNGGVNASSTMFYSPPYAPCPGPSGCITSLVPVDPNPGPVIMFRAAGFAARPSRKMYFDNVHYTNGVWAINDPGNPNANPGTFTCGPGATEIGAAVDIKYDIDFPHGNWLYGRVHEIQVGNFHLLIAHPYDPTKPNFPASFVEYKHKGNSQKHDVVEAPDGRRFHVHRRK